MVEFRNLREALSVKLADAPSRRINRTLGGVLAEDLEDILDVARSAAGQVQQIAPGVLQGAATGFLAGGPGGAVVGGLLGAAKGGTLPRGAAAATPGPVANPAALELLLTVLRPEVVEALIAMALGRLGAQVDPHREREGAGGRVR